MTKPVKGLEEVLF